MCFHAQFLFRILDGSHLRFAGSLYEILSKRVCMLHGHGHSTSFRRDISLIVYRCFRFMMKFLWLLVHPICSLFWITAYITYVTYPELSILDYLKKVVEASGQWMALSTVDNMIYGSWAFSVGVLLLLPVWTAFWCLMFLPTTTTSVLPKSKTE